MSLADELLADLEEVGGEDDVVDEEAEEDKDDIDEAMEDDDHAVDMDMNNYDRVVSVARLTSTAQYKRTMSSVDECIDTVHEGLARGPIEADPAYQLVVDVNELAVEMDNEMHVIHKFVRDKYAKRFPELESLVPVAQEYMTVVRELGNDIHTKGQNREILSQIVAPATVIVVSVTASTSQGEALSSDELDAIGEACDMANEIAAAKAKLFEFVEKRMSYIAPNVSSLLGAGCAAMLMGKAGGIHNLSKMPACNILVLGAQRRTLAGFSSQAVLPHAGYVYFSPLVQRLPEDMRRKAARQLAAKAALCARCDQSRAGSDGSIGIKFGEQVAAKFEKWLEPPPQKAIKPLPKPIDKMSKKRGGRRARAMKERLGMTEMRKRANRMNFAELQEDVVQTDIGFTMGQLKSSGAEGGRIRAPQVDQKSRVRMSKLLARQVAQANARGAPISSSVGQSAGSIRTAGTSARTTSGTASSVSFTPVQGLEIVNPAANQQAKVQLANAKYFGAATSFLNVAANNKS